MSLLVHPDPQHPAGGYAFLECPSGSLPDGQVTVAVFDSFSERWLAASDAPGARIAVGDPNWQTQRYEFGPYDVHRHDGADWVRVGPEIVNKLAEYTPLRLFVGPASGDVTWPDGVPPQAGFADRGAIQTVAAEPDPEPDVIPAPPLEPQIPLEPKPEPSEAPAASEREVSATSGRRSLLWPLVLLLLLLAGVAAAWLYLKEPDEKNDVGDSCTLSALRKISGFPEQLDVIRNCGSAVSADAALTVIEDAARKDDPAALLLFGVLYDEDQVDPKIEDLLGLSFEPNKAQAVEYYRRAVDAGAELARPPLAALCEQLQGSAATLERGAYDDYCR
ncbi:hypothetical protein [Primorskyibacter sp. S87]|uniref:hypothetical protein n=1 Tax=Primorskyibacter sp. S87 TaxID=3415126 RepID=UPI003C7E03A3